MQSRKRCTSLSSKKIIGADNDCDVSSGVEESSLLRKYPRFEPDFNITKAFTSTYFSTPGECTRSKTIKEIDINPFDLSEPPSDSGYAFRITCSTPLYSSTLKYRPKHQQSNDSGFDTESVSESILSFASKSSVENSNLSQDLSELSWSQETENLSFELKRKSSPVKSCSSTGFLLPILSDSSSNNVLIPQISKLTLANLLSGNHILSNKIRVFDCRFPYEYSGGHVMNSVNVYTCQQLLQTLFPVKTEDSLSNMEEDVNKMTTRLRRKLKRDDTIYIFYCEFSSYRGPKLAQCLRGLDRLGNTGRRDLYFPNIYVLCQGYKDFFAEYPQFCSPNGYVSMKKNPYLLRNINSQSERGSKVTGAKGSRKQHLEYEKHMRDSEDTLREIITKRTKDGDILQLFSSHPSVGGA